MKFAIKSVPGAGDLKNERIVLQATEDGDIGNYALVYGKVVDKTSIESGAVSAYWFPNKPVKAGSFVVLYTKGGEEKEKVLESGAVTYFYYWGLDKPQWVAGSVPVLVETKDWKSGSRFM